jgi:NADH-quinone oxidoreductase subunit J
MEQLFFIIFASIAVASAVAVVSLRNPVHSALFLIICFFNIAALFVLLRSPFLAAVQIFIYVGAVMVLFLFAVLVLDLGKSEFSEPIFHRGFWSIALILSLFVEITFLILRGRLVVAQGVYTEEAMIKNTEVMGELLYTKYIFPFEVISVLLLVTLVGATVLVMKDKGK